MSLSRLPKKPQIKQRLKRKQHAKPPRKKLPSKRPQQTVEIMLEPKLDKLMPKREKKKPPRRSVKPLEL